MFCICFACNQLATTSALMMASSAELLFGKWVDMAVEFRRDDRLLCDGVARKRGEGNGEGVVGDLTGISISCAEEGDFPFPVERRLNLK